MTRIIAKADGEGSVFELVFEERPDPIFAHNLRVFLEAGGMTVKEKCPDGKTVIWVCELPMGEIVTEASIDAVKQSILAS